MADDTHVGETVLDEQLEQVAHARGVHLDAEIVPFGKGLRQRRGDLAHPEADLQDARRATTEGQVEIDRRRREVDAEPRQQFVDRAALGIGRARDPQHEAADRTVLPFGHAALSTLPMTPPSGELGVAW